MLFLCMTVPGPLSRGDAAVLDHCISSIARGEQDALARLYERTHAAVYGFALSIVKKVPDAEDVLQDVYLQIWQAADRYTSHGKPMAWIITITRNLALSRLREQRKTVTMSPEDWQLQFADIPAVTQEDRLILETLLASLGEEERQIVTLHALTGLKHREIAALLALPLPTVLSKYNRALKKLQQALKEAEHNA